ncbi:hypothetical protein ACOMHN_057950 [Nucella lapillus]
MTFNINFPFQHPSFELAQLSAHLPQHSATVLLVPATTKSNQQTFRLIFFYEFPDMLEYCNSVNGCPLTVRDFDIHVDVPSNPLTAHFSSLINDFGLHQTVTFSTHQKGHTLDLVLSRADSNIPCSVSPDNTLDLSDHFCIVSQLNISRPTRPPVNGEARNIAAVDMMDFKDDLNARLLASPPISVEQLHSLLSQLLDEHAPATQRQVSSRPLPLGLRLWHLNSWKPNAAELTDTG